ncbi:hypothetical protein CYMTET_37891 [Cymbomonas tetramitiformis]|uniref:Cytochrome P450 n=1 Tax=Cymbomonas tetramitiformis TaxID=36881 RepID=A0AAE0F753_9CHLO|nr:hypothetical protein CYMTET_37891 [Cymbomonas tetramitiformis]
MPGRHHLARYGCAVAVGLVLYFSAKVRAGLTKRLLASFHSVCIPGLRNRGLSKRWTSKGGYWEVTSFDLASRLLRKEGLLSANVIPIIRSQLSHSSRRKYARLFDFLEAQILSLDGAEHKGLHRHLTGYLTPNKVDASKPALQVEVKNLIKVALAKQRADGSWDVVSGLAEPVPLSAILHLVGFPLEDGHQLKEWGDALEDVFGGTRRLEDRCDAALEAVEQFEHYLQAKLKGALEDSVISGLQAACAAGDVPARLFSPNVFFLLTAGHETTSAMIASSILGLIEHPVLLRGLIEDPSKVSGMLDELARYTSPVATILRRLPAGSAPIELTDEGMTIKPGDWVHILAGIPQRNERGVHMCSSLFASPRELRPERKEARRNIAFGLGKHSCIGSRMARLEVQVVLEELVQMLGRLMRIMSTCTEEAAAAVAY